MGAANSRARPWKSKTGGVTSAIGEESCDAAPVDVGPPADVSDPKSNRNKLSADLLKIGGVCVLATTMADIDATVVTVAQRTFVNEFSSTPAVVAWTMTGYMLSLMAVIPLAGWAADRFGTKRLFLGAVLFFALGSLLSAVAPNITLLVVFRMIQGLGGGIIMPLIFTILTHAAGPQRLGRLMSILSIPMMIAPICGPILGGALIDAFGWRSIFLINLPISLLVLVLAAVIFPTDEGSPEESFDFIGMLLLSPGLAVLLYGVSSVPDRGSVNSTQVYLPVSVGVVLIAAFVFRALRPTVTRPLIDLRLFKNRTVALGNATLFLTLGTFYGVELLFPSCFQQLLGQTPLQAGLHVLPLFAGCMVTIPIALRITGKRGPGAVVLVGIVLFIVGMSAFAYGVSRHYAYTPILSLGLVVMGIGMGCLSMPIFGVAVMSTLKPHEVARGSTLINVNQRMAISVGTALMSVILTGQFNRSVSITASQQAAASQETAAGLGGPPDPSQLPAQIFAPHFMEQLAADLSHAYAVVFVVAVCVVASAGIPALFLVRKSGQESEAVQ